jgi:hypothetical protein
MKDHRHSWLSFGRGHANAISRRIAMLGSKTGKENIFTMDVAKSRDLSVNSSMTLSLKLSP